MARSGFRMVVGLLVFVCGCVTCPPTSIDTIQPNPALPASTPWDLNHLSEAPAWEWLNQEGRVRSLFYQGEPLKGRPTRVFAYYATPGTLKGKPELDEDLPAVVLVHGGGGTAFLEWVTLWARRGYAAIAMDLGGRGIGGKVLFDGGPPQNDEYKFGRIDGPQTDQWSYHAVANVILAHSLIRNMPGVDPDKTALTGISWGGYLTCIVAGLDNRFKAAVPVYGCGFLGDNSVWLDRFAAMTPEQKEKWLRLWDPSQYVGCASMPMFFVNGTNDFAYPLDSYEKTYNLVQGKRNHCITVNMPHGHQAGWQPREIGQFIDQYVIKGTPLPRIGKPSISKKGVVASVKSKTAIQSAQLHYTTDTNAINKREWKSIPAEYTKGKIVAPTPSPETTIYFVTATDEREAIVSSPVVLTAEDREGLKK